MGMYLNEVKWGRPKCTETFWVYCALVWSEMLVNAYPTSNTQLLMPKTKPRMRPYVTRVQSYS